MRYRVDARGYFRNVPPSPKLVAGQREKKRKAKRQTEIWHDGCACVARLFSRVIVVVVVVVAVVMMEEWGEGGTRSLTSRR
jgi:hypothetical protein